jgi:hypothetical protein
VNLRLVDWIWQIRGTLPLPTGQSGEEALGRLEPLFGESGTSHERTGNMLTFRKQHQLAQDKMSVFDGGVLQIEPGAGAPVLRYRLVSRALLFCFLAPLLFLGIAQITIAVGHLQKQSAEAADAKKKAEKKKADKKDSVVALNPIDKALGAPEPEKPKKDGKDKDKDDDAPSPTSAYVFAGIFAALYVAGRIVEAWLVRRLFRKSLLAT